MKWSNVAWVQRLKLVFENIQVDLKYTLEGNVCRNTSLLMAFLIKKLGNHLLVSCPSVELTLRK
jgi:hypothetical protein